MTTPSSEPQNIDEVILALQADPIILVKDKSGQVGSQKTKYADLVQLNQVAMPRLTAFRTIYVTRPNIQEDARFALEWELKHLPSDTRISGKYPLKLAEQPMQMGSAITYARRYILTSILNIAAEDEDDDAGAGTAQRRARRAEPEVQQQVAQRKPSGPPLPNEGAVSRAQKKMFALFRERGVNGKDAMLAFIADAIGRKVASRNELDLPELAKVITALELLPIVAPEIDDEPAGGTS
jgi:hypothetical protein